MNARLDVIVAEEITDRQTLSVKFVTTLAELAALKENWESFNRLSNDHESPFFQSYAWCEHVAKIRLQQSSERFRLCVATVWRGDMIAGVWPLSLQKMSGAWIVKNLDDPYGQFAGVVFRHRHDIAPGIARIFETLKASRMADGLLIDAVVEGTPLHIGLTSKGLRCQFANLAVYVDLRAHSTFDDYAETLNKKTLKNLRNALSRLRRRAEVASTIVNEHTQVGEIIAKAFAGRLDWMHEFGRTSPAFRDGDFRKVIESLSKNSQIELLGFSLMAGNDRIATQWGFTYLGKYYAYLSARDAAYDEFSPGRLHLGMVIEACKAHGIDVLELMPPANGYKLTWTDRSKRLDRFSIAFNTKGYIALNLLRDKILPSIQRASRLIPNTIRKRLVSYLNLK
jgi:CelD/BcsL family acetyltransferase involved in cellulose biosynthesis